VKGDDWAWLAVVDSTSPTKREAATAMFRARPEENNFISDFPKNDVLLQDAAHRISLLVGVRHARFNPDRHGQYRAQHPARSTAQYFLWPLS
jgi:hypothetical protein